MSKYILMVILGMFFGWVITHVVIGEDCLRLGAFYVGKVTFECAEVKKEGEK